MEEREYPKSPPIFENVDGAGFSDAKQAKLPIEPKQPELMCYKIPSETDLWRLHHAAPFAAVRWTNIYDPALLVFFGDIISGPVAPHFGNGIIDVDLRALRGQSCRFTHTRYWAMSKSDIEKPGQRLVELRKALDLAGDRTAP